MTNDDLRQLAEQAAIDAGMAMVAGFAAGTSMFRREMMTIAREAKRETEALDREAKEDDLTAAANDIEEEKARLKADLKKATGLKLRAIKNRLRNLEALEARLCEEVDKQTEALALPALEVKAPVIKKEPKPTGIKSIDDRHTNGSALTGRPTA